MMVFGPVPSRRLGRSLGINNIPPKICTYSCIYCQLGPTFRLQAEPCAFFSPEQVYEKVSEKVKKIREIGQHIDYLSFVPDGEPTLDCHLGHEMEFLKSLGLPLAVISNASLMGKSEVRTALSKSDWVSLKVDAVEQKVWRRINRPHHDLRLTSILEGILEFAETYRGKLVTETMLVRDVNDDKDSLEKVAAFLGRLNPSKIYLSVPTRPPAERWVHSPDEQSINRAYQILSERVDSAECLITYEGNAFTSAGDLEDDLLSITSVHPMREDAVEEMLIKSNADWAVVRKLIDQGQMAKIEYEGNAFYMRKLNQDLLKGKTGSFS